MAQVDPYLISTNCSFFEGPNGQKYGINPFANMSAFKSQELPMDNHSASPVKYCRTCNMIFAKEDYMQHVSDVHGKKKHQCFQCQGYFKRHDHLKRHVRSVHSNDRYPCGLCSELFTRRDILSKHMKSKHSGTAPLFQCKDCSVQCTAMNDLEDHEKACHVMFERQSCPHCPATFKRRDHMLRHVKSQHLNHVIICPVCSQQYKRRDHLTRHLREKHDIRS